jgi:hypothetical protein
MSVFLLIRQMPLFSMYSFLVLVTKASMLDANKARKITKTSFQLKKTMANVIHRVCKTQPAIPYMDMVFKVICFLVFIVSFIF